MNSKEVIAGLKAKLQEARATAAACETALAAFGDSGFVAIGKAMGKSAKRKGSKGGGMQAAHDAMAVKRGVATPEQKARWEKRQAAKEKEAAEKAARKAAKEGSGASLAEAAEETVEA